MRSFKNRLCFSDVIVIILVLALSALPAAAVLLRGGSGEAFTVSTPDGVREYSLSRDTSFQVESCGIELTVTVSGGKVSVTESGCPDGVCVSTGEVSRPGQSIVCVPARTVITVTGKEAEDADWIP